MSKVCLISTVPITMKSFVIPIAEQLAAEHGHDVTIICSEDERFALEVPDGITYRPVQMARGVDLSAFHAIAELIKIFKKEQYDLIQYCTPNASLYSSIAGRIARIKIRVYCQWGIRYLGFSGFQRRFFKTLERITCHLSTAVRSASNGNLEFAVNEGLYPKEKAAVIGRGGTIGVDLNRYDAKKKQQWGLETREHLGIPNDAFVFGFAGRVSRDKGCIELIQAFQQIFDNRPDAILLVIGPKDGLEDFGIDCSDTDWRNGIVFTDYVENSEMHKFYSALDVLVHPSYREGFGMVIQEAAAMLVPSVTTNIIGASEVLEPGVSCLLAEPRDVESLRDAMEMFLFHPEIAREFGINARVQVERFYDRAEMLKRQCDGFNQLLMN